MLHDVRERSEGNPDGSQNGAAFCIFWASAQNIKSRLGVQKENPENFHLRDFNIWYTQRKRQGIKLAPEENTFSPGETFPVSPVA